MARINESAMPKDGDTTQVTSSQPFEVIAINVGEKRYKVRKFLKLINFESNFFCIFPGCVQCATVQRTGCVFIRHQHNYLIYDAHGGEGRYEW